MAKLLLAHDHFAYMGGGERMLLRVARIAARLGSVRLALPLAKDCGVLDAQPERALFADAQAFGLPHRIGLCEMPAQ